MKDKNFTFFYYYFICLPNIKLPNAYLEGMAKTSPSKYIPFQYETSRKQGLNEQFCQMHLLSLIRKS